MPKSVWTDGQGRPADLTLDYEPNLRRLGFYMAQVAPVKSGRLREELRDPRSYQYNKRTKAIRMLVDLPYAQIQDTGGRIPARVPVRARVMRFWIGNMKVFSKYAKGYYLQGSGYVQNGFDLWMSARADDNIRVYWGRRSRR